MKKIGLFDSGIGGISVLLELKNKFPNEEYIYYADYKNNPYGEKSKEELISIGKTIIDKLINNGCYIIIIACNTMTLAGLEEFKKAYPNILFIGTIPPIKEAFDTKSNNILLMATPFTLNSQHVKNNISLNMNNNQRIIFANTPKLAPLIETYDYESIYNYLKSVLLEYNNIDLIVLGCTHYSLIKNVIRRIINVEIIDSSMYIYEILNKTIIPNNSKAVKEVVMLNSLDRKESYQEILLKLSLLNK